MAISARRVDRLHQILLTAEAGSAAVLPERVDRQIRSLREVHPDADYRLWRSEDLRGFIAAHFDSDTVAAYDVLTPFSYKCDLGRFCLLYELGGLYVDIGLHFINPLRPPNSVGFAAFSDYQLLSPNWTAVNGAILWSEPKRRELQIAIEQVIANCKSRYYGANPLYPTGPVLLGRAIAAAQCERGAAYGDDQWIGVVRPTTPGHQNENCVYISPDQTLVALRAKSGGGDLGQLGLAGTNNYNSIWNDRRVYGERLSSWDHLNEQIRLAGGARRTPDAIRIEGLLDGNVLFGPYTTLLAGNYKFTLMFTEEPRYERIVIDVTGRHGTARLAEVGFSAANPLVGPEITLEFATPDSVEFTEFRLHAYGQTKLGVAGYSLETR